ncbi:MAG: DUF167 domain-containing protein [Verrucomicrobiae bacterium]|nr:DUF167 domain-containing protein [Verrucomicrobiae bacterium]
MSVRLQLRVVPNAPRDEYVGVMDDGITHKLKLSAPPIDGKANKALLKYLVAKLGVPKEAVSLSAGLKSRNKAVTITGVTEDGVIRLLSEP